MLCQFGSPEDRSCFLVLLPVRPKAWHVRPSHQKNGGPTQHERRFRCHGCCGCCPCPPRNPTRCRRVQGELRGGDHEVPPLPGSWHDPGFPREKGKSNASVPRGPGGGANPGPGGRDEDPLPMEGERDTTRRGKNRERPNLLHGDRTSEGVPDVRGVPPGSFGFPPETVPRQWDPSVGGLLPLHPSDALPGGGRRPRRSQDTKTHRTALRDGFPRGGAGRSEEPSDHVTHEGRRITDGLWIGRWQTRDRLG